MYYTTKLFAKIGLSDYFEKKKKFVERRVNVKQIRPQITEEEWTSTFLSEYYLEPITINLEERKLEYRTRTNNPELLYIVIKVPFTASKDLIDLTPPQYSYEDLPLGVWGRNYIKLRFRADILDSNETHRAKYNKTIETLKNCIEAVNKEVNNFNLWLDSKIKPMIKERFNNLRRIKEVADNYKG